MKSKRLGFSLIEFLVVCAALALIITLTISHFPYLDHLVVRAEVESLHAVCRYMQRKAISTNTEQRLICDCTCNCYTFETRTYQLPSSVIFGCSLGVKGPPAHPNQSITHPITYSNNTIIFYPTGIISAGTVYLTDKNQSCCYALSNGISHVSHLRKYIFSYGWKLIKE